ncbi:hypothetical protein [Pantoea agglomerans]|uniref:hypothetical protein n=1 Tax=Enterobacter agglomerans TaxID=549 RepID=UPI00289A620C|nr:hypothetical protein [Pantoea agglomerans]WNK34969.1 hypothetical protein RM158_18335 [Pantoea agglomerans]
MRIFFRTVQATVSNLLESVGINNAFSVILIPVLWALALFAFLFLYLIKIVFLWPFIFFTAVTAVFITVIPVLMLTNPLFTPDAAFEGMIRVFHQLPHLWVAFILLGLMADMLLFLSREYNREFVRAFDLICKRYGGQASGSDLILKQRG